MNPLVRKLEDKLLPEFEKVAEKIRREISNVNVRVYATEVGTATNFQGHSFFIYCILNDAYTEEMDNVSLSVDLCHLTTTPRINSDVCWGHPSGYPEAEFPNYFIGSSNDWLVATDECLEELYENLPRLYEALFEALRRRKPGDE